MEMKDSCPDRRSFIKQAGSAAAIIPLGILASGCGNRSGTIKAPPNIILVFSDDHAFQALSCYGSVVNKTPNLDRLASEGMLFDKCCVTNSICAPSRAVVLTGKHSHLNSVRNNRDRFDGTQQTFPKILKQTGYQTAIVGKWHLKTDPTGFDFWEVLPGQGSYYNPDFRTADGDITEHGYVTDIIHDKALDWLENKREPEKPFMLMIQNKAPHRAWQPGPDHLDMYEDTKFPEPANLFDTYEGRGTAAHKQDMNIAETMRIKEDLKMWEESDEEQGTFKRTIGRMDEEQRRLWDEAYRDDIEEYKSSNLEGRDLVRWKYQRYMEDYLRCIASVDDNFGRVLDYLEENDMADNTVILYASDQGFYLGEHGWFDKRFMYKESFFTPFMVRWPGVIEPGSTCSELVSNLDFAETFMDLAGAAIPGDMQGLSLKPLFRGETPGDWRESVYYNYYEFPAVHSVRRHEGVFDGRYKLMYFYDLEEWELYDTEKDPGEMKSEYDNPEYSVIIEKLKVELEKLKEQYKVTPPEPLEENPDA